MGKNTSSSSAVVAEATCSAPVNIAVIKYWGKRDSSLLLPTNSSLSLTLSQDHLQSKTTVRVMKHQHETEEDPKGDALFLNGVKQDILANKRFLNVIHECRLRRVTLEELHTALPRIAQYPLHIVSENNFPTAAGLASSASGFACLTYTIAQVYGLISSSENEVQLDLDLGMVSKVKKTAKLFRRIERNCALIHITCSWLEWDQDRPADHCTEGLWLGKWDRLPTAPTLLLSRLHLHLIGPIWKL